jgi:hypothetical protein
VKVKSIDILTGVTGTDKVGLNLEAASPFPEMGYPACATVECRHGFGLAWAEAHFPGVHIEMLDAKTGKKTIKSATGVLVTGGAGLVTPEPRPFSEEPEEPRVAGRVRRAPTPSPAPPRGDDRFPIQDNGPEQPDYGRGGDGPPAPYCRRCETYHWNRCTR